MIIAIFAQIASLLSACILPQATPKYYFATPILSAIATVFLLMAIVIYAIKSNVNYLGSSNGIGVGGGVINPAIGVNGGLGMADYYYHYGYSFWLAILAFILMVVSTIIGFLASKIYRDEAIRYYNGRPNPAAATY
uniref:NADH dehydrogenase subunit 6 n=1 Tax=Panagrolaimus superbus TaxID=310955 RepID=A0A914Y1X1_9BILA